MKFRILAGVAAGTAALAFPAAAQAVTYQPVSQSDPSATDSPSSEPANGGIDIVNLRGVRSASQFSISVKVRNLKRVDYSRRFVALVSQTQQRGRILEFRTGPAGSPIKVAYYAINQSGVRQISCAGARAVPDTANDKITFVIPASCYPDASESGAALIGQYASYTADTWTPGPLSESSFMGYDQIDSVQATWNWSGAVNRHAPSTRKLPLF